MNRQRLTRHALLVPLALVAVAGFAFPAIAQNAPAPASIKSTADQREEVSISVYNQNFGLVREVRTVDLPTGRSLLEFRDVSERIQTETVSIKSLGGQLRVHLLDALADEAVHLGLLREVRVARVGDAAALGPVADRPHVDVDEGAHAVAAMAERHRFLDVRRELELVLDVIGRVHRAVPGNR